MTQIFIKWNNDVSFVMLLAEELINGGEVFFRITGVGEHAVDLVSQRTERIRGFGFRGRILHKAQVLRH